MPSRRTIVIAAASALALCATLPALSGCGQTGPLYLPHHHKGKHAKANPPAPKTASAPKSATR